MHKNSNGSRFSASSLWRCQQLLSLMADARRKGYGGIQMQPGTKRTVISMAIGRLGSVATNVSQSQGKSRRSESFPRQ